MRADQSVRLPACRACINQKVHEGLQAAMHDPGGYCGRFYLLLAGGLLRCRPLAPVRSFGALSGGISSVLRDGGGGEECGVPRVG